MGEDKTMRFLPMAMLLLVPAFAADVWRPLFNGKDLDGWSVAGAAGKSAWAVEDGAIRTQPGNGMLWYTGEKIGNATLRVVYKLSASEGNSGVFIRIPSEPADETFAIHHGIEVQIDDRDDDWHCTGVLYSLTKALSRPTKPAGEWNTMDIIMAGARTIVKINSALVTDYDGGRGSRPESGYIALQHHDDHAVVYFREISVRR